MRKEFYIKESDVLKAMENNSHMMEVFGTQRKMIDGMLLCYDIAELEQIDIQELRAKVIDEFAEAIMVKATELSEKVVFDGKLVGDALSLDCISDMVLEIASHMKGEKE